MKRIRIGILGGGRGVALAKNFMMLNCDIVALCDFRPERLEYGATCRYSSELPAVSCQNSWPTFSSGVMERIVLSTQAMSSSDR